LNPFFLPIFFAISSATIGAPYLTEIELQECTLDLLNLVREVIFSLKNAIQISENEKQSTLSSEVALIPINYEEVDLEDKL